MKRFGQAYARLVAASAAVALVLGLIGYVPTVRVGGPEAAAAMAAGIAVSLVAGCVGAIPVGFAAEGDLRQMPQSILLATALRFLVVLVLVASLLFSGWFDKIALGLWTGMAYLVMLVVDSAFAIRLVRKVGGNHS